MRINQFCSASYSPASAESAGCPACSCCSFCFLTCQQCGDEDETKHVRKILGITDSEEVRRADNFTAAAREEEKRVFEVEAEEEEEDGEAEEDEVEEDEDGDEAALVLHNVVLVHED